MEVGSLKTCKPLENHHMKIDWHDTCVADIPIREEKLYVKGALVGRVGLLLLACGTGAWQVRHAMNRISRALGLTCSVDVGLVSINYSCFDGHEWFSQTETLATSGVNTYKLKRLERFVRHFTSEGVHETAEELHQKLDAIERTPGFYKPWQAALAAGAACAAFTFLLGGGWQEMLLVFPAAFGGQYVRARLLRRHYTMAFWIVASIAAACLVYTLLARVAEALFGLAAIHEAGYICSMLFIIPGFPFITSGIDLAKLDLRSGLERLAYALFIVIAACLTAWILALALNLHPADFTKLALLPWQYLLFRLLASFTGVFGFSVMFNSSPKMCLAAACIGAIANTLRLEMLDFLAVPPAFAAFIGAFVAGLLASLLKRRTGIPRITMTVPSIVIMVPGLYMYKGIYNLGALEPTSSFAALASAILILLALPAGLVFARLLADRDFRYCS